MKWSALIFNEYMSPVQTLDKRIVPDGKFLFLYRDSILISPNRIARHTEEVYLYYITAVQNRPKIEVY
jgi:hypothetical protein